MTDDIKSMQLYPRPDRIYRDLERLGYGPGTALRVDLLNQLDQLHYHGTQSVDAAISACALTERSRVLEVGSGWGGCARYVAQSSGAQVSAVELQQDYNEVAIDLTERAGLAKKVAHVQADFLSLDVEPAGYDHAVSWLALFHIPEQETYLGKLAHAVKPGGVLFVEDLVSGRTPTGSEAADIAQHLFPNSLTNSAYYQKRLVAAGFEILNWTDMTDDWASFTADRLTAFRDNRAAYQEVHGAEGFQTLDLFYDKMAGYFANGLVGGVRYSARRQ